MTRNDAKARRKTGDDEIAATVGDAAAPAANGHAGADTSGGDTVVEVVIPASGPRQDRERGSQGPRKTPPRKAKPAAKARTNASPKSLSAVGAAWIESLKAAGHSDSTCASYRNDLVVAYAHLGADTAAGGISEKEIAAFETCKAVMKKKNGKAKAKPTILKTRRALRLALTWAAETGLIAKAPYAG